jgi:hypothetical protein
VSGEGEPHGGWIRPSRTAAAAFLVLGLWTLSSTGAGTSPPPAQKSTDATKVRCAAAYEQAQELRRQDKLSASRSELYICEETCPRVLVQDCRRWRSEVDALMPTVLLRATDAQGERVDARVLMDGKLLVDRWGEAPVPVDTGDHTFRFESATGLAGDVRVSLHGGEREREIHAVLVTPGEPKLGGAPPASGSTTGLRPLPKGAYILGVVGLSILGVGGTFTLIGHAQAAHLASACAPSCSLAEVATVRTLYDVAWVGAGVGAASLVAGLLVWRPWSGASDARPAVVGVARAFVMPTIGGATAGFEFQ